MKIIKGISHTDHNLTPAHLAYFEQRFADRTAFFIETFELPVSLASPPAGFDMGSIEPTPSLPSVECRLYGPIMGDTPEAYPLDARISHEKRGDRTWTSRLVWLPSRQVRTVTVIAGPHDEPCSVCAARTEDPGVRALEQCACGGTGTIDHGIVLYTAYGGPAAPQEPGDPNCRDVEASTQFWAQHALAR